MTDKEKDEPEKDEKVTEKRVAVLWGKDATAEDIADGIDKIFDDYALEQPQKAHRLYPTVWDENGKRIKKDEPLPSTGTNAASATQGDDTAAGASVRAVTIGSGAQGRVAKNEKNMVSIPRRAGRQLISQYPQLSLTDLKRIYRFEYERAYLAWGNYVTKGKVRDRQKDHLDQNKDIIEFLARNKL